VQANDGDGWGQKLAKAFREDQWKFITTKERKPLHLFDLSEDLAEENDLIESGDQKQRVATMLRSASTQFLIVNAAHLFFKLVQKPVLTHNTTEQAQTGIFRRTLSTCPYLHAMKPTNIPDGVRVEADEGPGTWRVQGKHLSPFSSHRKIICATWDASSYRLLGLPVCNKQVGVTTVSARLNNSKPLGWGRHCVGSAVALHDEHATVGFVFPITAPQYDGPRYFQDQLGKPNGHRHHWRQFFPADIVSIVLDIESSSGRVDLEISDIFAAWEATPERERLLHELPYLDQFGQVRAVEWPGKLHSLNQLKKELPAELSSSSTWSQTKHQHLWWLEKWPTPRMPLDGSVLKKLMIAGGLLTRKGISFFLQARVLLALKQ